jgi:hypothetical protein
MSRSRKRHTVAEIAAKLDEGTNLAAAGRTQSEIARALGVSVMTFHRWRKAMPEKAQSRPGSTPTLIPIAAVPDLTETERLTRISELQLENARLRKLVTDLLLEKMSLEDEVQRSHGRSLRKA